MKRNYYIRDTSDCSKYGLLMGYRMACLLADKIRQSSDKEDFIYVVDDRTGRACSEVIR